MPVTCLEPNSPDLERTAGFLADAFGWRPQPFAPDYLVAPYGDGAGMPAPADRSWSSRSRSRASGGAATSSTRPDS